MKKLGTSLEIPVNTGISDVYGVWEILYFSGFSVLVFSLK
jgi:hypothetical protein